MERPLDQVLQSIEAGQVAQWEDDSYVGITTKIDNSALNTQFLIHNDTVIVAKVERGTGAFSITESTIGTLSSDQPKYLSSGFPQPSLEKAVELLAQCSKMDLRKDLVNGLVQWIRGEATILRDQQIVAMNKAEHRITQLTQIIQSTFQPKTES